MKDAMLVYFKSEITLKMKKVTEPGIKIFQGFYVYRIVLRVHPEGLF